MPDRLAPRASRGTPARQLAAAVALFAAWFVSPAAGQEATVHLADGTHVVLRLMQFISSETSAPGDPVRFGIQDDVVNDAGIVTIKRGTVATATITLVKRSRWRNEWWSWPHELKSGCLVINLQATYAVDGQRIPLRATPSSLTPGLGPSSFPLEMEPHSTMQWAHDGERFNAFVDGAFRVKPTP